VTDDWRDRPLAGQPADPAVAPPAGPPADPPPARRRGLTIGLGIAAVAFGVLVVSLGLPRWLTQPDPAAPGDAGTTEAGADARRIQATLFYIANDGVSLASTSRNVLYGETPVDQARHLVEAQIADPPPGLLSAIPAGTTLRALFLTDAKEVYVDLGGAILTGHPGGLVDEALTVYTIVNAVMANLPEVTGVQILVEGREVDSLRGHIDLRAPLARSSEWIQKGSVTP
jgi:hypothetical protein